MNTDEGGQICHKTTIAKTSIEDVCSYTTKARHISVVITFLTLSARPPFQNFSTSCILNVNNTGAKQGSIMK
jgi:hypothetical protein